MTYEEFKAIIPQSKVTAGEFPGLLFQAEAIVQDLMVYRVDELSDTGLKFYNDALALQVDYVKQNGATEGKVASQNVNGVSASFALTAGGADALNVSPLAQAKIRAGRLCVRF